MFDQLMTDRIQIHKKSGEISQIFKAVVSRDSITMDHNDILVEPGDLVVRRMSNGAETTYEVLDPVFYEGGHGIPAHYQMSVRRIDAIPARVEAPSISYQITGANNRILHHSTDNSTNSNSNDERIWELYAKLEAAVLELRHLSKSESEDAAAALQSIEAQLASEKPNKRLIQTMIDLLPTAANAATIGSLIISLI